MKIEMKLEMLLVVVRSFTMKLYKKTLYEC